MHHKATNLIVPALLITQTPPAQGEVVYSQPSTSDAASVGLGWYSSSEPRPTRSFKHADNFALGTSTTIGSIRWWGLTEGNSHTDLSNFDTFTIEFYSNRTQPNGNIRPLDLIASTTIDIASTNAIATGRTAPSGAIEYMHEATLTAPLSFDADTTYWVAISAHSVDPSADAWQWQDSDDFDTLSSSFDYNQNRWLVLQDTDSAFELIAVPSPSVLASMCIAPLLSQRRRRS